MTLLTDTEKVELLVSILNNHIEKLPRKVSFADYLETIRIFLTTKDPIIQKDTFTGSEILIENLSFNLRSHITLKQAVGTLIGVFDKVGYLDSIDAAAVILEFEELLKQMTAEEAKNLYDERWSNGKD